MGASTAAVLLTACGVTDAQTYPIKPIRVIVPFAPGSTADIVSRFVADELEKALGNLVVVENKPGAGGLIGTVDLAHAAPDGYTIGFASEGTLVFNQGIYANPGYDSLHDFTPIALLGYTSNVMVVHPSNAASTPADIITLAKSKPDTLTYASGGSGTSQHVAGVLFARTTGTDLVHVPYSSTAQAVRAVMANEVTMGFFNTPVVVNHIDNGELKALAVMSLKRSSLLPNVPTLDQQGVAGCEMRTWGGFFAPIGTPKEVIRRLNAELNKAFSGKQAKEKLELQGFELSAPMMPQAITELIAKDLVRWLPVVKPLGAKMK